MRDSVCGPKFLLQKELSLRLEQRFPEQFIPRYSMVMFHHEIPYTLALERGRIQQEILDELTVKASDVDQVGCRWRRSWRGNKIVGSLGYRSRLHGVNNGSYSVGTESYRPVELHSCPAM